MVTQLSPDLQRLIDQQMATGEYASEEAVLADALHSLAQEKSELRAIQEALEGLDRGELGVPVEVAFASLLAKYGIAATHDQLAPRSSPGGAHDAQSVIEEHERLKLTQRDSRRVTELLERPLAANAKLRKAARALLKRP